MIYQFFIKTDIYGNDYYCVYDAAADNGGGVRDGCAGEDV